MVSISTSRSSAYNDRHKTKKKTRKQTETTLSTGISWSRKSESDEARMTCPVTRQHTRNGPRRRKPKPCRAAHLGDGRAVVVVCLLLARHLGCSCRDIDSLVSGRRPELEWETGIESTGQERR